MAEKTQEQNKEEDELSAYEKLNNTQKCAILMMLLGEEEASEILKNLGPKEVQQLGKEMYNVQGLDQDTVNQVLDEFLAVDRICSRLTLSIFSTMRNCFDKWVCQFDPLMPYEQLEGFSAEINRRFPKAILCVR